MSTYEKVVLTADKIAPGDLVVVPSPASQFDVEVWAVDKVKTADTQRVHFRARRAETHDIELPKSVDFVVSREGPRETPLVERERDLANGAIEAVAALAYGQDGEFAHEIRVRLEKYRTDRRAMR